MLNPCDLPEGDERQVHCSFKATASQSVKVSRFLTCCLFAMTVLSMPTQRIAILISGGGSNMRAIVEASNRRRWNDRFGAVISGVVSNQAAAAGLQWAEAQGIPTRVCPHRDYPSREAFDEALMQAVDGLSDQATPDWVVLAGFMRILTPAFVQHYDGRLLNIHPSLLPAFPGLNTHQRAIEMGCRIAGATVHRVTAALDHGEILGQAAVPVLADDTPDQLAARVLTQEHRLYPDVLERLLQTRLQA
jgi:phosphoribosylglycinamide formyltransferase-1